MAERPPLMPVRQSRGPSRQQIRRRRIVALGAVLLALGAAVAAVAVALPHVKKAAPVRRARRPVKRAAPPPPPPPPPPKPFRVIFPEGFTRAQMIGRVQAVAKIARRKRHKPVVLRGKQYAAATRRATLPCFTPKKVRNLEGF